MRKISTNILDRISLLGIKIWDFGWRSVDREYSWFFLFKIIFQYPIQSLKGFQAYKKFCKTLDQFSPCDTYGNLTYDEIKSQIGSNRSQLLVAMGYCQRPLKTDNQPFTCPSKRFSHDCYFIENYNRISQLPPACSICEIRPIAELTWKAGAFFHIMTSALAIARDIFILSLRQRRFQYAILFICPYSVLPIMLPLFICGIRFLIIPYASGDCRNYGDFVRADLGIKNKRTFPTRENNQLINDLLKKISSSSM